MTYEEEIIRILRRRIRVHLSQVETYERRGMLVPAHVLLEIEDARAEIAKLKATAKRHGITIADEAIDSA